jgi:hypothetical protein
MAAGNTYEPIATTTLGSATANVTFSSISGSYTDLVLVINAGVSTTGAITVQLNADTGTNYSVTRLYGDGSTATSDRFSSQNYLDLSFFPNTLNNNSIIHFMNYSNTTTNKTILARWNSTSYTTAVVGLWRNTAAVNSIKLYNALGYNLIAGSTFSLYGIKNA